MALRTRLPLLPEGAEELSEDLAVSQESEQLVFFNASGPIYWCGKDDPLARRLAAAMFAHIGLASTTRLAAALGLHRSTIYRNQCKLREGGAEALKHRGTGPRGPHKLKGEVRVRAQVLLDRGESIRASAAVVGVSEGTIRQGLKKGWLVRPEITGSKNMKVKGPRERSDEDRDRGAGVAVKRHGERMLARRGMLQQAEPVFVAAEAVPMAGALLALPALLEQGLLEVGERVYVPLGKGYYGLRSVLLALALMALLRIRSIEQITSHPPGELGLLLGLDRVPEVKCLRAKLRELGRQGHAFAFAAQLAQRWAKQTPDVLGFLYIDGHVRPYCGRKHRLPKTHVPVRRLCMPATTDFWVNDANAEPLFWVTAPANDHLLRVLDEQILSEIRALVGPERRITLIFDREGWSPKCFKKWFKQGFDVLTYRKGNYQEWPRDCFQRTTKRVGRKQVSYQLGERSVLISKDFWMREVRRLCKNGHQTSIMSTRQDLPAFEIATRMFARWRQENFFRYMRREFALDHLCTYAVEPADPQRTVPNPARKQKRKQLSRLRSKLGKLQQQYGDAALNNPESKQPTMRGFKISHRKLGNRIHRLTDERDKLVTDIKALPERVPLNELLHPKQIVQLERERKLLTDAIKMIAYRAETALATLLQPFFKRHQDETRKFLKAVFQLPGDLLPDTQTSCLVVRLHGMANDRSDRALSALCDLATGQRIRYPGTDLRLVFKVL